MAHGVVLLLGHIS